MIVRYGSVSESVEGGELVQVVPYGFVVGVEDVRAVCVDVNVPDVFGEDVSGDVVAFVDDEDGFTVSMGFVSKDSSCESSSYY